jgi:NADPH-dependent curcumin reductase CurA
MAPPPADDTDGLPAAMREILAKSLTLRGFIYSEFAEQHYAEFLREVGAGIADGRIRYREDASECYLMTCDTNGHCAIARSRHRPRL